MGLLLAIGENTTFLAGTKKALNSIKNIPKTMIQRCSSVPAFNKIRHIASTLS